MQRPDQPEVLVCRRDHFVTWIEIESGEDEIAAIRGGSGQRHLFRLGRDQIGELGAQLGPERQHARDVVETHPAFAQVSLRLGRHGLPCRSSERSGAAGLQIGHSLEHRELRACLVERHEPDSADGRLVTVCCKAQ